MKQIIKRNNITAYDCQQELGCFVGIDKKILDYITTEIKYEGYIEKEQMLRKQMQEKEDIALSIDFDYNKIKGLRLEAIQKLNEIKPLNIAQASRISGVNPADIAVLLVYLKSKK